VENCSTVKLQNNIGTVNPGNPYQIFGPQPSVGSYLDIRNSNIFNRYTKALKIKLNWLDLPKIKGGFVSYFQAIIKT